MDTKCAFQEFIFRVWETQFESIDYWKLADLLCSIQLAKFRAPNNLPYTKNKTIIMQYSCQIRCTLIHKNKRNPSRYFSISNELATFLLQQIYIITMQYSCHERFTLILTLRQKVYFPCILVINIETCWQIPWRGTSLKCAVTLLQESQRTPTAWRSLSRRTTDFTSCMDNPASSSSGPFRASGKIASWVGL